MEKNEPHVPYSEWVKSLLAKQIADAEERRHAFKVTPSDNRFDAESLKWDGVDLRDVNLFEMPDEDRADLFVLVNARGPEGYFDELCARWLLEQYTNDDESSCLLRWGFGFASVEFAEGRIYNGVKENDPLAFWLHPDGVSPIAFPDQFLRGSLADEIDWACETASEDIDEAGVGEDEVVTVKVLRRLRAALVDQIAKIDKVLK